jgi:hypothetical protein
MKQADNMIQIARQLNIAVRFGITIPFNPVILYL